MLWFALAVMTGAAVLAALWPLAFRRGPGVDEGREAAFYQAQLAEIDRDVERGQLPREEAAAARAEAGRRLITASAPKSPAPGGGVDTARRRIAAIVILVVIPLVALGLYATVGRPELPDEPLAARKSDASSPEALELAIAKIEAHLTASPDDKKGWEVLAPVYMRMGRFQDAEGAYRQLVRLEDQKGLARAAMAEAIVAGSDGIVTSEAREAFEKSLAETPGQPMPRFYLALAAEQDGDAAKAKATYEELAPQAKGRAPWMVGLRARLAAMNGQTSPEAPTAPSPQAAGNFSPEQQDMIKGMVSRLADRLAQSGGNSEEWARLIRAYSVLHETEKAKDAVASARRALGNDAGIDALARELGL